MTTSWCGNLRTMVTSRLSESDQRRLGLPILSYLTSKKQLLNLLLVHLRNKQFYFIFLFIQNCVSNYVLNQIHLLWHLFLLSLLVAAKYIYLMLYILPKRTVCTPTNTSSSFLFSVCTMPHDPFLLVNLLIEYKSMTLHAVEGTVHVIVL